MRVFVAFINEACSIPTKSTIRYFRSSWRLLQLSLSQYFFLQKLNFFPNNIFYIPPYFLIQIGNMAFIMGRVVKFFKKFFMILSWKRIKNSSKNLVVDNFVYQFPELLAILLRLSHAFNFGFNFRKDY